jgi:hypothetical protein
VRQKNLRSRPVKSSKDETAATATLLHIYTGYTITASEARSYGHVLGSQNAFPVTCKKTGNIDPNTAFMLYNI